MTSNQPVEQARINDTQPVHLLESSRLLEPPHGGAPASAPRHYPGPPESEKTTPLRRRPTNARRRHVPGGWMVKSWDDADHLELPFSTLAGNVSTAGARTGSLHRKSFIVGLVMPCSGALIFKVFGASKYRWVVRQRRSRRPHRLAHRRDVVVGISPENVQLFVRTQGNIASNSRSTTGQWQQTFAAPPQRRFSRIAGAEPHHPP